MVAAPILDLGVDDATLDGLLDFFEKGGTMDLSQEGVIREDNDDQETTLAEQPDPETIQKAEEVVKLLTAQMAQLDARVAEQQAQEACDSDYSELTADCEPCKEDELDESIAAHLATPDVEMSQSAAELILRIPLPLVESVGDIDAEVVGRSKLELRVDDLYSLDYELPEPVDDEDMVCRFEKATKTLVVKMPRLS